MLVGGSKQSLMSNWFFNDRTSCLLKLSHLYIFKIPRKYNKSLSRKKKNYFSKITLSQYLVASFIILFISNLDLE